jgi:hypothetical protein
MWLAMFYATFIVLVAIALLGIATTYVIASSLRPQSMKRWMVQATVTFMITMFLLQPLWVLSSMLMAKCVRLFRFIMTRRGTRVNQGQLDEGDRQRLQQRLDADSAAQSPRHTGQVAQPAQRDRPPPREYHVEVDALVTAPPDLATAPPELMTIVPPGLAELEDENRRLRRSVELAEENEGLRQRLQELSVSAAGWPLGAADSRET